MNILCISKYASLPEYGTGSRLFYLAKEFNKLGHPCSLITSDANHVANYPESKNRYNFSEIEGVQTIWIRTKKYKKSASIGRVLSWLNFELWLFLFDTSKIPKPNVVLVSSLSIFSIFYGYYLKRKYNAFLIFEIRDIWPLTMTEEGGFSKWHPLVIFIGWVEKFGYKVADLIVGTMPKLDLHVKEILGYEKPFHCSPLGFNELNYISESINEEGNFKQYFPEGKTIIGYAGSMGISNALEPFIESIKRLNSEKNLHFMLVGSGDLKSHFENKLKNCSNVTFLPRISQKQVKEFLKYCDVLYLSTQNSKVWKYGQSMNKIVEYMLAGKPIIGSYQGYPSMVNEANCGIFIDSVEVDDVKDSIIEISKMPKSKLTEMGARGRQWIIENRTYKMLASQYIKSIESQMNLKQ